MPEEGAGAAVEGADGVVEVGGGDEDDAAGGDDGAAVVFAAGIFEALGGEFGIVAEGDLPEVAAGVEVDGVESAPGRLDCGVAVGVEELAVAGEAIFGESAGWGQGGFDFLLGGVVGGKGGFDHGGGAVAEEAEEGRGVGVGELVEGGHAAFSGVDVLEDLLVGETEADAKEAGVVGGGA